MGVVLFRRGRSGIQLTAEGAALASRAEAQDVLLRQARIEVASAHAGIAGPLRVGGTPGALVSLLPPVVDALERAHGRFALNVIERSDRDLMEMLRLGEIDLAFVTTEIESPPTGIIERTFSRDPFALIVGRSHDGLGGKVSLHDVHHLQWVLPEAQGAFRRQVDALFISAELPLPPDPIRCDSLLTTKAIVRSSSRVTILPRQVAAAEISIGVLRAIDITEARFERSVGVRMLADGWLSPMARTLLAALAGDI